MMDSIERMRRINDLTRELKQHGFAESSFEAIKQANQIYGPDEVEDHVKNGMIRNNSPANLEDEKMDENSINNDRKIAKVTESVNVLTEKMNEIIRAINDLDARITEIKQTQNKLAVTLSESRAEPRHETRNESSNVERSERSVSNAETKNEDKPRSSGSEAPAKDEYSVNQRTGNFQSQDVAIDKMFYFGKK